MGRDQGVSALLTDTLGDFDVHVILRTLDPIIWIYLSWLLTSSESWWVLGKC